MCGILLVDFYFSHDERGVASTAFQRVARVCAVGDRWKSVMWISNDQAAEIYARFCKARYGSDAIKIVRERIAELRKAGDVEGERIWSLVANEVEPGVALRLHSAA